ncbi:MAG: T9SS type A sorting domain-containing protein [Bacteroidales bacterium]|nr:T9SS type A sorting domain-containing protein [Bacteroidales bacterium]
MKKLVLSFILFVAMTTVIAQSVQRDMVSLEIGTGTWCTYCPGAAMGADDLLEAGCHVAVVENHNGDPFANTYSNARNSYYAITGYPTATFDGVASVVGGSHSNSMYGSYLGKYNQRINIPSNVEMTMDVSNVDLDYTVVITLEKVGTIPPGNLKMRFNVTQSHIQYSWQGQTHLNFVNRLMVPNASGTAVDFSSGDVQVITLEFTMDASWPVEDCEFVAFLQSDTYKEIYNASKRALVDLNVDFEASATQVVKNTQVTFTNATTGGYIGALETYEWLFPGAQPATSTDKNPTVMYKQIGTWDVSLIVDRGGQVDTLIKSDYITVDPGVGINSQEGNVSASIYPNPNNGSFKLELKVLKNSRADIQIFNNLGSVVYEENGVQINGELLKNFNLNLGSGIYFLVVRSGSEKTMQKLFITQ